MTGLFREALESESAVPLSPPLIALAVLLVVVEVVARRYWSGPSTPRLTVAPAAVPTVAESVVAPAPGPVAVDDMEAALAKARRRAHGRTGDGP